MTSPREAGPVAVVRGQRDEALAARVIARRRLVYDAGPDRRADRPAHVRAGSALSWFGGRLAVVQDDASFVAFVDLPTGSVQSLALPRGPDGHRQFDDRRGNKAGKLDLEASVSLRRGGRTLLLAFGSGSTEARETIVVLDDQGALRCVDAAPLYARLRACERFSGSELNVEGAALVAGPPGSGGGTLLLAQRGNGAPRAGREPVDALCALELEPLLAFLDDPRAAPPEPHDVVQVQLGALGGARLTLTDLAAPAPGGAGGAVWFAAAAEASPDVTRDGPVRGVALGVLEATSARWAPIRAESGAPLCDKVEGLVVDAARPGAFWAVVDHDDPDAPAELLHLVIEADRSNTATTGR